VIDDMYRYKFNRFIEDSFGDQYKVKSGIIEVKNCTVSYFDLIQLMDKATGLNIIDYRTSFNFVDLKKVVTKYQTFNPVTSEVVIYQLI